MARFVRRLLRAATTISVAPSALSVAAAEEGGAALSVSGDASAVSNAPSTIPVEASAEAGPAASIGQDTTAPHFRVYTRDGRTCSLNDLLRSFFDADVVLIGEAHDDPVAHQLELYLLVRADELMSKASRQVVLSLEMFEKDAQHVVDEYLQNVIREEDLLMDARPWANYSDYRPIVEYAKRAGIRVIAANAPRRYVTAAGRRGLGALRDVEPTAKAFLPPMPLPAASADYKAHFAWSRISSEGDQPSGECPYIGLNSHQSVSIDPLLLWDATMASSIAGAWASVAARPLVVHVCGSFHSEYNLGIAEYLQHYTEKPLRVVTVSIYPEESIGTFQPARHTNAGDWVILTDGSLPRSHDIQHPL